jgi:hypothetical protein
MVGTSDLAFWNGHWIMYISYPFGYVRIWVEWSDPVKHRSRGSKHVACHILSIGSVVSTKSPWTNSIDIYIYMFPMDHKTVKWRLLYIYTYKYIYIIMYSSPNIQTCFLWCFVSTSTYENHRKQHDFAQLSLFNSLSQMTNLFHLWYCCVLWESNGIMWLPSGKLT